MRLGSIPSRFIATSEVAPKSSAIAAAAVSMKKHVFARPPDPNASPQPTTVRRMASRLRAGAGRELRMPAPHVRKFVRKTELRRLHEIEPDEPGDIGDREAVAGDEPAVGELAVEKAQELDDPRLVGLAPGRDLRHLHLGHRRVEVAEDRGDGAEQAELKPPLPHLDAGALEGAGAEQRRLCMQLLEVAADRDRLADDGAVVELESGGSLKRVDGDIGRRLVLEPGKVDRDDRDRDALLGEKYPHPARVRRPAGVVKLHRGPPSGESEPRRARSSQSAKLSARRRAPGDCRLAPELKRRGAAFAAPGGLEGQEETSSLYPDAAWPDVRWRTWKLAGARRASGAPEEDG